MGVVTTHPAHLRPYAIDAVAPGSVPQRRRPLPECAGGGRRGVAGGVSDVDAALPKPRDRIDLLTVEPADVHLEVEMRAGGPAAVAQQRDRLAGAHHLAGRDQDLLHVPVDGDVTVVVLDVDGGTRGPGRA